MLASKLLSAAGGEEKIFVDDVFATVTRTGTGATATVTTGFQPDLLWTKCRNTASTNHALVDSQRGDKTILQTNTTAAQSGPYAAGQVLTSTGYGISSGGAFDWNYSGYTYVDWVWKKAPKFFDCGTFVYDGSTPQTISHSLGVAPGMILIKKTSGASSWYVYHRGLPTPTDNYLLLEGTTAYTTFAGVWGTGPTASTFQIKGMTTGESYVYYAFAHDTSADGIVQCGSYTGNASVTGPTVNLGWEPQYVMVKRTDSTGNWLIQDNLRSLSLTTTDILFPNLSNAATTGPYGSIGPNATGFQIIDGGTNYNASGANYIYLAIRRPNKPPTTGTQVYNAALVTETSSGVQQVSLPFAMDLDHFQYRSGAYGGYFFDRLRGIGATTAQRLNTYGTHAEQIANEIRNISSATLDHTNNNLGTVVHHFFKRAPGVFETLCYTGTGSNKTESHGLSVAPELWLIKKRNSTGNWVFGSSLLSATEKIVMPSPNGRVTDTTVWNSTLPTSSAISLGTSTDVNASASTYVSYLWATKVGVSKVFTYTGNGSTQTINCGFSTGARFVMILRVTASTAQDIFIWDSARGIVSGNDPRLSLNTTAAEVTTLDSIDPDSSGFIVNTDASNINVNGAVYIGLAYA